MDRIIIRFPKFADCFPDKIEERILSTNGHMNFRGIPVFRCGEGGGGGASPSHYSLSSLEFSWASSDSQRLFLFMGLLFPRNFPLFLKKHGDKIII